MQYKIEDLKLLAGKEFLALADEIIAANDEGYDFASPMFAEVLAALADQPLKIIQFADYLGLNFSLGGPPERGMLFFDQKLNAIKLLHYAGIVPYMDADSYQFEHRHKGHEPLFHKLRFVETVENSGLYPDAVLPFLMRLLHPDDYRDVAHTAGRYGFRFYAEADIRRHMSYFKANPAALLPDYPNAHKLPKYSMEAYFDHLHWALHYGGHDLQA